MPELPDVTVYVEAIAKRVVDQPLLKLRLGTRYLLPFYVELPVAGCRLPS
jgi:hypothetical protein